jgi:DNA polymerase-3 subunit delta'
MLADLIGQDAARTALLGAIARGHVAHAYLFEGAVGVGKRSAALGLAMALNCAAAPGQGCGKCEICTRIEAGMHPDVPSFGPTGAAGQIVFDTAQAILALARTRPHEANARVIIIDDADAMNPSAANCLLKTLEEPLARNHMVLCTAAPDRLLPTIRSRKLRGVPHDKALVAATLADGSAARLFATAAEEDQLPVQTLAELRAAVAAQGAGAIFDFAAAAGQAGDKNEKGGRSGKDDLARVLGLLARLYRDALAVAAGAPELAVLRAGGVEGIDALAPLGVDRLGRALAAIVDVQASLAANVKPTLAIERLLIALKRQHRPAA